MIIDVRGRDGVYARDDGDARDDYANDFDDDDVIGGDDFDDDVVVDISMRP